MPDSPWRNRPKEQSLQLFEVIIIIMDVDVSCFSCVGNEKWLLQGRRSYSANEGPIGWWEAGPGGLQDQGYPSPPHRKPVVHLSHLWLCSLPLWLIWKHNPLLLLQGIHDKVTIHWLITLRDLILHLQEKFILLVVQCTEYLLSSSVGIQQAQCGKRSPF